MKNVPNILTFIRLFLSAPLGYCIISDRKELAVAVVLLAFVTDFFDGFIARKFDCASEFGRTLDPLADKTFVTTAVLSMLYVGLIPIWFVVMIIARDLLILCGGLFALRRLKVVIPSNNTGRAAVTIIGFTLLLALSGYETAFEIFSYVSTAACLVSLAVYSVGLAKRLQAAK